MGSFKIKSDNDDLHVGSSGITSTTGLLLVQSVYHELYVTSPDEIWIVSAGNNSTVTVFHNR